MAENVTNELMFELLKAIRGDVGQIKGDIRDLKEGQISIREELQAMRRDALRQERTIATLQMDVDRVKTRLDLFDPSH